MSEKKKKKVSKQCQLFLKLDILLPFFFFHTEATIHQHLEDVNEKHKSVSKRNTSTSTSAFFFSFYSSFLFCHGNNDIHLI